MLLGLYSFQWPVAVAAGMEAATACARDREAHVGRATDGEAVGVNLPCTGVGTPPARLFLLLGGVLATLAAPLPLLRAIFWRGISEAVELPFIPAAPDAAGPASLVCASASAA
jgi:hypothetical protein